MKRKSFKHYRIEYHLTPEEVEEAIKTWAMGKDVENHKMTAIVSDEAGVKLAKDGSAVINNDYGEQEDD